MPATRPEIGARLDAICFQSGAPDELARFFAHGFGMDGSAAGDAVCCAAPERRIFIADGKPNSTAWFAYAFATAEDLARHRSRVTNAGVALLPAPAGRYDAPAFAVRDPDGNLVVFGTRSGEGSGPPTAETPNGAPAPGASAAPDILPARLQHVVFRSTQPDEMVRFYEERLGFVVSDRVRDPAGVLRACFLRTDLEHHSLAIFRAAESRLDHHSYETRDWEFIRRWADHLAKRDIPIFWGVGRHGPGDDLFFMVKDPDGNLVEISAEIEQCAIDRKEGLWPHAERTLNVWGNAILRS